MDGIKSNKKKILLGLLIIVILFICYLTNIFKNHSKINGKDNKISSSDTASSNLKDYNWTTPNGNGKKLFIIKIGEYLEIVDTTLDDKVIGTYTCDEKDCKPYDVKDNYIIVYDKKFYIYNYKENKRLELNLEKNKTKEANIIVYDNDLYGVVVRNFNDTYNKAIYLISKNDFISGYIYSNIKDFHLSKKSVLYAIATSREGDLVISLDENDTIYTFEKNNYLSAVNYEKGYYYIFYNEDGKTTILDENFNKFKYDKVFGDFTILKNGNIVIANFTDRDADGYPYSTSYSVYNIDGKLIKNSKKYSFLQLYHSGVAIIIEKGYLKLINLQTNKEIKSFLKWDDKYVFLNEYYMSDGGMLEAFSYGYDFKETEHYFYLIDSLKSEGEDGYATHYIFNSKTGDFTKDELDNIMD